MEFSIIEQQLNKIPEKIKKLFFSVEVAQKIAEIGEKNEVPVDKIDALIEETGLLMIGLNKPSDFTNILVRKLNIKNHQSYKIAQEINDLVLIDIKPEIQKLSSQQEQKILEKPVVGPPKPIAHTVYPSQKFARPPENLTSSVNPHIVNLEREGQFKIDHHPQSSSPQYNEENLDKDTILKHIEDDEYKEQI